MMMRNAACKRHPLPVLIVLFLLLLMGIPQSMSFSSEAGAKEGEAGTEEEEKPKLDKDRVWLLSSVKLRLWGKVSMNVHYDTDDIRGNTDFATYITAAGSQEVNFNPRDTRVGFSAGTEQERWKTGLVTEIDFYGDNADNNLLPRLRLGYLDMVHDSGLSFRLGQDWIPVGQLNPDTVDFGVLAWGGNLWWRVPQITIRGKKGNFHWLGSVMKHRISNEQESQEDMPWAVGRFQWSSGQKLLALGMGFRDVEIAGNEYSPWMAALEFQTDLGSRVSLKGELWSGAGIGREFVRYGLDYNPVMGEEIKGNGGFVSLTYIPARRFRGAVGLGMDRPDRDGLRDGGGMIISSAPFIENRVMFANIRWNLDKRCGLGLEVMDIDTLQNTDENLRGQRYTLSAWYAF